MTGKKDDHGGQGGCQNRQADLIPTRLRGSFRQSAHFQMAVDVLERDHRVIDDPRKGQRQASQNHRVHRTAHQVQHHEGRERRKGNGKKNRGSRPQAPEKEQNHNAGENESDEAFVKQSLNGFLDEDGLIEHQGGGHLLGNVKQVADQVPYPVDHLDGIGIPALLHDGDVTRFLAVHSHLVVLNLIGVFGLPHVPHRDPRGSHRLDGNARSSPSTWFTRLLE